MSTSIFRKTAPAEYSVLSLEKVGAISLQGPHLSVEYNRIHKSVQPFKHENINYHVYMHVPKIAYNSWDIVCYITLTKTLYFTILYNAIEVKWPIQLMHMRVTCEKGGCFTGKNDNFPVFLLDVFSKCVAWTV